METLQQLSQYVAERIEALHYPAAMGGLKAQAAYALGAGGKHLRPVLTLATCMALGGSRDQALNQALGVEIFHNFTLVHDDVMDKSDTRRGKPTVWARWDETAAILSGDAMLTLANMYAGRGAGHRLECVLDVFNTAAMEVYAGQELDMQFEERLDVTTSEYLHMILLKTAALIRCACAMGVIMADGDDATLEAMKAYAVGIGMAFQLRDDYLDTYGDAATFGKPIGGDILNDKKTWFLTSVLESDEADNIKGIIADNTLAPEAKIESVKEIYDRLELPGKCTKLVEQYTKMAVMALDDTPMSDEDKKFFREIAESLKTRAI